MSLTLQEIRSQHDSLPLMLSAMEDRASGILSFAGSLGFRSLAFLGCGSSFDLARSAASAASLRMRLPAYALAAGDVWLNAERYLDMLDGSLVVPISRSGSTSEVLSALAALGGLPAGVLSFSCVENSALESVSGYTVAAPFAFDESICQTRTVSCLYLGALFLTALLSGDRGLILGLRRAVQGGRAYMSQYEAACADLASGRWDSVAVLSDAELDGIGSEGALAFKEIARTPSNHYHLLDARHGPMVLFSPRTLVVAVMNHQKSSTEADFVADAVKKGSTVITYSDLACPMPGVALNACFGELLPHAARGLPFIMLCQMLAYHKATALGVDPDQPEGLSAWIKI